MHRSCHMTTVICFITPTSTKHYMNVGQCRDMNSAQQSAQCKASPTIEQLLAHLICEQRCFLKYLHFADTIRPAGAVMCCVIHSKLLFKPLKSAPRYEFTTLFFIDNCEIRTLAHYTLESILQNYDWATITVYISEATEMWKCGLIYDL